MKEKEKKMGSLHSKHYNVSCDLILSHMPEDLEKGNSLIVRFSFSESHCKLFLFKFLSHFLICVNTQQPTVLRVYNLQICATASISTSFYLSYLCPIMIKTSSTLEKKCKCFLKQLQFFCKVFPSWTAVWIRASISRTKFSHSQSVSGKGGVG